jgi:hypothetical protein
MNCDTCGEAPETDGRSVFETANGETVCTDCRVPMQI